MISLESATGALALVLSLSSYALKTHRALTSVAFLAVLCWGAHFWFKGALTPAALALVVSLRIALSLHVVHLSLAQRQRWTAGFLVVTVLASALTWQGWLSVPSTVATLWLTFIGLNWKGAQLRLGFFVGEGLWLTNAVLVGSLFAVVTSVLATVVNLVALWRYHPQELRSYRSRLFSVLGRSRAAPR